MRLLTRLGVSGAALALGASATFTGIASAQDINLPGYLESGSVSGDGFNASPASTLRVSQSGKNVEVTYANKTSKALVCGGILTTKTVAGELTRAVAKDGKKAFGVLLKSGTYAEFYKEMEAARAEGKLFVLNPSGMISDSIEPSGEPTLPPNGGIVEPGKSLVWKGQFPADTPANVALFCGKQNEDAGGEPTIPFTDMFSYGEYLAASPTSPGGGGTLNGSGSLGSATGSLGS